MSFKSALASVKLRRVEKHMEGGQKAFPDALRNPKQVLVCLPAGLRELTVVKQFLPTIQDLFKPATISLLTTPDIRVADILPRKGFNVITTTSDQAGWTGMPKKSFLESLQKNKFDTILDLNLDESVFTSAVLLAFPAALRIGRGNHRGNPYYNLEIKTKYLRDERNIYRSMLDILQYIKTGQFPERRPNSGSATPLEESCT